MLVSVHAGAGWWSRTPADFEECAASAEKDATSADDKDKRLTACGAKFAGRRKPGGGYTYYDFMQNRHFDIAGPNPTAQEQKYIDEQYAAYLKDQRRGIIAAAFFQKQQQVEQAKADTKIGVKAGSGNVRLTTAPKKAERQTAEKHVAVLPRPRPKMAPRCEEDFFSTCRWSQISAGVRDFKKALFGSFSRKGERS